MAYAVGKKNIKNCNEFLIRNGNFSLWLVTGDERFQVLGEFFTFYMLRSYQFGRATFDLASLIIISIDVYNEDINLKFYPSSSP